MKKRILSLALAVLMLVSLVPGASAVSTRPDYIDSLSSSQYRYLYNDLLRPLCVVSNDFGGGYLDRWEIVDEHLMDVLSYSMLVGNPILNRYGGQSSHNGYHCHRAFTQANFDAMTRAIYGKTLDMRGFQYSFRPDTYDYFSFQQDGWFYLFVPQMGYLGEDYLEPENLVRLSENLYYTNFSRYHQEYPGASYRWEDFDGAVVQKNGDGTWSLVTYYPDDADPAVIQRRFVTPSSWAKTEISAAQKAGLVPTLDNEPWWVDNISRLQFCQLAVRLAERATGKSLPAPADPFGDTNNTDVCKAYAAGIVKGITDTTFKPGGTITREQLATMLWRTVQYIQTQTGHVVMRPTLSLNGFTDAGSVSAWAIESVSTLSGWSILNGHADGRVAPKSPCTVEQAVLLVYRTYGYF